MPKITSKSNAMVAASIRIQKERGNIILNSKTSNGAFAKSAGKITHSK